MPPRCQLLSGSLSLPIRLLRHPQPAYRTFATSQPLAAAKGGDLGSHLPKHVIPRDAPVPEYPYGDSRLFKQADKGLYGGQRIQFGNNVSHRTKTKTRRVWMPNVVSKSFYSVILKKKIKLRVTTNVIKTMEREGGLDEYLLKDKETRVKELGPTGWALRWWLMQTPAVIDRMRAEAAELGLAQDVIEEKWPREPAWRKQVRSSRGAGAMTAQPETEEGQATEEEAEEPADQAFAQQPFSDRLIDSMPPWRLKNLYLSALEMGEVDAIGGRMHWLAKTKAEHMLKNERIRLHAEMQAEQAAAEAAAKAEETERIPEEAVFGYPKTTDAGAWDDVVDASKTKPQNQTRL